MRVVMTRIVVLVLLAALAGCEKKDGAPRPTGTGSSTASRGVGVVNAGLASAEGGALETAKSSLVAQQCALGCGVRPENDPGLCTQRCLKECINERDVSAIDACAQRIASP